MKEKLAMKDKEIEELKVKIKMMCFIIVICYTGTKMVLLSEVIFSLSVLKKKSSCCGRQIVVVVVMQKL